jgi:hypothetical protein
MLVNWRCDWNEESEDNKDCYGGLYLTNYVVVNAAASERVIEAAPMSTVKCNDRWLYILGLRISYGTTHLH